MKYKILKGKASEIDGLVNEHLKHGWELLGGPFNTGNTIQLGMPTCGFGSVQETAEIGQAVITEIENG